MKSKYRILQIDDRFFPQKRILWFWKNINYLDGYDRYEPFRFNSLNEAKNFVEKLKERGKVICHIPKRIIHSIPD